MGPVKSCFIVITAVLLIQSTFSASILGNWQFGNGRGVSRLAQDVPADFNDLTVKRRMSNPFVQLRRLRRNTAQWYVGSQHFNDYNHERQSRRWNHRRHNNSHQGRGQIVDA